MQTLERKIAVPTDGEVSSVWSMPEQYTAQRNRGLILAHGAGNDMNSPFLSFVHAALAQCGLMTVKFNFPYMERGLKAPDRPPALEATWRAVIASVRNEPNLAPRQVFLAGKSMGGRIASQIASQGEECAGLIFLGYPLHPPNKSQSLRVEPLARIRCPMLFIQGTRDALCRLDLLKAVLESLQGPATLHEIEDADHSFKLPKRVGRSEQDVWSEVVDVVSGWMTGFQATNFSPNDRAGV